MPNLSQEQMMVERVARAISDAAWNEMRAQGFSGGWDHDELGRKLAQAAIDAIISTGDDAGLVERLWLATKHGDEEHQAWLRDAYTAFFAGEPVPEPRGQGRKEAAILSLTARNKALEEAQGVAWLVEFPPSGDHYSGGKRVGPAQPTTWVAALIRPDHVGTRRTSNANEALRFARKEDAEGFISAWLRDDYGTHKTAFASEHIWLSEAVARAALNHQDNRQNGGGE
jgi:hypothetical protein